MLVNFKLSLIVLSCLPDLTDKKRRIENSFRTTSYKNKLSKIVKLIERWVMDTLKREKDNENVFHCNDTDQRKSKN